MALHAAQKKPNCSGVVITVTTPDNPADFAK
jgi:hypothetical protein